MHRLWIVLGSLAGLTAVGMAAYTAHALPRRLDAAGIGMVQSGLQMQGWHALALVLCGVWAARAGGWAVHLAGAAFTLGVLGFCGGVYTVALTGTRLGPLAPTGGVLLMAGWALLAISALAPGR